MINAIIRIIFLLFIGLFLITGADVFSILLCPKVVSKFLKNFSVFFLYYHLSNVIQVELVFH